MIFDKQMIAALEVQKLSTKVWVFKPLKMTFQSCNSGDSFWSLGLGVKSGFCIILFKKISQPRHRHHHILQPCPNLSVSNSYFVTEKPKQNFVFFPGVCPVGLTHPPAVAGSISTCYDSKSGSRYVLILLHSRMRKN